MRRAGPESHLSAAAAGALGFLYIICLHLNANGFPVESEWTDGRMAGRDRRHLPKWCAIIISVCANRLT